VVGVAEKSRADIQRKPYGIFPHYVENGTTVLQFHGTEIPIEVFGNHNLQNINAAYLVCEALGISTGEFMRAIASFKGASKRLELVKKSTDRACYKDFAHSPSKLKATTQALKDQFPNRRLIACMELHTFSSLNKTFLEQYDGAMASADEAYVYFNTHTLEHKKLPPISSEEVRAAFNSDNVKVITNTDELLNLLREKDYANTNLLMMSSGNFDGIKFEDLM
jgi:UDP-N-acetylmuramate: L-alanyl-gamma-D-glutamyl-meso-diaminopimelate ligase